MNSTSYTCKVRTTTTVGVSLWSAASNAVVPEVPEPAVTYFHNDISGCPMLATDGAGAVIWKENYRPYGERLNNQAGSSKNKIGFAGKQFDAATGLSYMGARYYDPVLGRFMGVDPVGFKEGNVHSFNRYTYANNNPYKFVDPDGKRAVVATSLQPTVNAMRQNSPVFRAMFNKLDKSPATYEIIPMSAGNPSTWFLPDPASGQQIVPGTYTIGISSDISKWKYLGEDGEKHPFSLERAIVHEVAHPALGTGDEGKVIGVENSAMKELQPGSANRRATPRCEGCATPYPIFKPEKTNAN